MLDIITLALSAYVCSYALEEQEQEEVEYYEIYESPEYWDDEIYGGD